MPTKTGWLYVKWFRSHTTSIYLSLSFFCLLSSSSPLLIYTNLPTVPLHVIMDIFLCSQPPSSVQYFRFSSFISFQASFPPKLNLKLVSSPCVDLSVTLTGLLKGWRGSAQMQSATASVTFSLHFKSCSPLQALNVHGLFSAPLTKALGGQGTSEFSPFWVGIKGCPWPHFGSERLWPVMVVLMIWCLQTVGAGGFLVSLPLLLCS